MSIGSVNRDPRSPLARVGALLVVWADQDRDLSKRPLRKSHRPRHSPIDSYQTPQPNPYVWKMQIERYRVIHSLAEPEIYSLNLRYQWISLFVELSCLNVGSVGLSISGMMS